MNGDLYLLYLVGSLVIGEIAACRITWCMAVFHGSGTVGGARIDWFGLSTQMRALGYWSVFVICTNDFVVGYLQAP